jgi:HpcH/HpaI aldolase/citrate lyase family
MQRTSPPAWVAVKSRDPHGTHEISSKIRGKGTAGAVRRDPRPIGGVPGPGDFRHGTANAHLPVSEGWRSAGLVGRLDALLAPVDAVTRPTRVTRRQPVHTAYVPADAFDVDTARDWGRAALLLLREHAPRPDLLGVDNEVYARVVAKLEREPVEDLRVDFEDGYGDRPADEEDRHARAAGVALVPGQTRASGLRIKSFEPATRARALRTLDLLVSAAGRVPDGFVVTLPKVSAPEQVRAIDEVCVAADAAFAGAPLRFELQVETPSAVARMAEIVAVAGDRCAGLHYGTYDYSAALGVAAAHQSLDHPVADHAKAVMQVAAAAAGLRVVDGSSNVLPVGDTAQVRAAWSLHMRLVDRSMRGGIYQGWDLHPGQLVSRYAAAFSFYRNGFAASAARLRDYRAKVSGGVLDEPATARALADYLARGLDCGALDDVEVSGATGLGRAELDAL